MISESSLGLSWPRTLPDGLRAFLAAAIERLRADSRLSGLAAGGSFLTDTMDEFSDLDLVVVVDPDHYPTVLRERELIAAQLGPLLAAFTGEHVGEPRLLICLYGGTPPQHVDLKFVALPDLSDRIEDPRVLWERDEQLTAVLRESRASYPPIDLQWLEDRFWVWIHYGAAKVGRGELFEALGLLSFLRGTVLGPLALLRSGARPAGVRRVEQLTQYWPELSDTVASHDALDCLRALRAAVASYRSLRGDAGLHVREEAEEAAVAFLQDVERRVASGG